MEEEVHETEPVGGSDDFPSMEGFRFEEFFLVTVEVVVFAEMIVGGEEESAGSAGRVNDGFSRLGVDAFDHCLDEGTGREVLSGSAFCVFGVLFEESFVDVAFDVGGHGDPVFTADDADDFGEFGGVADFVLCSGEDFAEESFGFAEFVEGQFVLGFEFGSGCPGEFVPGVFFGDPERLVVRRFAVLFGHFEEDEVGELFQVVTVGYAVISEDVAE